MSYHINPTTKRPNICKAEEGKCEVASKKAHYATADDAKESLKPAAKPVAKKAPAKKPAAKKTPAKKAPAAPKAPEVTETVVVEEVPETVSAPAEAVEAVEESVEIIEPTVGEAHSVEVVEVEIVAAEKPADETITETISDVTEKTKEKVVTLGDILVGALEDSADVVKAKTKSVVNSPVITKTLENVKNDSVKAYETASTWSKNSFKSLKDKFIKKS